MDEMGYVIDQHDEYVVVNIKRKSACGSCKACELGKSNMDEINVDVKNSLGAAKGDYVRIQMQTPDILKAAFLVYMIPLLALLSGITAAYLLAQTIEGITELHMLGAGAVLMLLSLLYVRKKDADIKRTEVFEPIMVEVVSSEPAPIR